MSTWVQYSCLHDSDNKHANTHTHTLYVRTAKYLSVYKDVYGQTQMLVHKYFFISLHKHSRRLCVYAYKSVYMCACLNESA